MHDQTLEGRLRAALQAEGDRVPFAITPAELERRLAERRRGLGPMASLGLAAALGIGLLGLAGLAGGWFERESAVVPGPSSSATASDRTTSPLPSAGPTPSDEVVVLLPSLDDLLAEHDPATVVRAQAMGPAAGPAADARPDARWMGFAPMTDAGTYAVEIACLGSDDLQLQVVSPDPDAPGRSRPFNCDGASHASLVDLAANEAFAIFASQPASWRVAILASGHETARVDAIADIPYPSDRDVVFDGNSEATTPDYGPTQTGGGLWLAQDVGTVANRPGYRVTVSCAGPNPIRYAFGTLYDEANGPDPLPEDHSTTQVECDGALHEDRLDVALVEGARVVVTSDPGTVWRIQVTADKPPVGLAPDGAGWTMSTGFGPNWMTDGTGQGYGGIGPDDGGPVRIVITCLGEATLTGTIDVGTPAGSRTDPFSIDCSGRSGDGTLEREYAHGSIAPEVVFDPHGGTIWLAITTQIRRPATTEP